ncbi:hypothetical protein UREOM_6670 [Ureaplasma sp. OM1]|uniref:Uncharacterized protein n=1 Tax=Ureaplasma ceti TaxID=3119530 RepID=A0ABP9UAT5_9BACT
MFDGSWLTLPCCKKVSGLEVSNFVTNNVGDNPSNLVTNGTKNVDFYLNKIHSVDSLKKSSLKGIIFDINFNGYTGQSYSGTSKNTALWRQLWEISSDLTTHINGTYNKDLYNIQDAWTNSILARSISWTRLLHITPFRKVGVSAISSNYIENLK